MPLSRFAILEYPDKRLRQVAPPITHFDEALRHTVAQLFDQMYADDGVGLAATQVGLPLRLFVMDCSQDKSRPVCMINPEIIEASNPQISEEGCLSFPKVYTQIHRPAHVIVRYQDEWGEVKTYTADDLEAHCIHHERDHLDGILFIDHLSVLKRQWLLKKLDKARRQAG